MRIAYFTLPVDDNYGGNLQRYALMTTIRRMGHEVMHVNLYPDRRESVVCRYKRVGKFAILRMLSDLHIHRQSGCLPFYNRYIPHTHECTTADLQKLVKSYDAYLVGSDQVWRASMARTLLPTYFFDFLPEDATARRIAYGVSFGESECDYSSEEKQQLKDLYSLFDGVSVREDSGMQILKDLGWMRPQACQVIDPTCLLTREQYHEIIKKGSTYPLDGKLYCYVLDDTNATREIIAAEALHRNLRPTVVGYKDKRSISVEQWLRGFLEAEFVVTDSYHGFLFSLIFNKPVRVLGNVRRGNARFDSLCKMLHINPTDQVFDWKQINATMQTERNKALDFLKRSL